MNRSEKISRQARHATGWALVILMAAIAMATWAARVWQSGPSGGAVTLFCALAVFRYSVRQFQEAWRLATLAALEEYYECERSRVRL